MKISLGQYFSCVDAAENLEPNCSKNVSQIRMIITEAEKYCNTIGQNKFIQKFQNNKHWKLLGNIVESLRKEEVETKIAELYYDLFPKQEAIRMLQAQADAVINMLTNAINNQKTLKITYIRKQDDITKEYIILPQEISWFETEVGLRRVVFAESEGKVKVFYISRIRSIERGEGV